MVELNKVYCMDNLELMKQIDGNSIDLIYCDILYGTGKKFKDYHDLKPQKDTIDEFYTPRIQEMHRILKDTGIIYLQMDWRINHWIRIIMDDIFGYKNFRNEIIWCYDRWTNSSKDFIRSHDNILRYSKSDDYIYNEQYEPFSNKSKHKGSRVSRVDSEGKLEQMYVSNVRQKSMKDVWNISILNSQAKERVGYDTQKPKELLERIIKSSSIEGDVVADFFCGSGTTGVVAKELGRNYIMCDIVEKAVEISKERLSISNNKK